VSLGSPTAALPAGEPPEDRRATPRQRDRRRDRRWTWHRFRKATHLLCFAIFLALPFFDIMRFDIPRQRFYFVRHELWISEFAIIFFALTLFMIVIGAAALLYGRVYCAYLCPQMIFSEASIAVEKRLVRCVARRRSQWILRHRRIIARVLFDAVLALASALLAFIFVSYFVEPRDLLRRLLSLDVSAAGGIAGATTTLLTFLDFAFLRLRFCTAACPYGYLQGFLADDKTLLVTYRDPEDACIDCKKCLRVCHMGIDIRRSAHQIECVHCGECIDACADVLGRLGGASLIHYAWGDAPRAQHPAPPWWIRAGLFDPKRIIVGLVVLGYASGLWVTLGMRNPILVRVSPDRSTLYQVAPDGRVSNRFRLSIANRGRDAARVSLGATGLDGAVLSPDGAAMVVPAGETLAREFDVVVTHPRPGVQPFRFVATWTPADGTREFPMTFIAPEGGDIR
jgi:cytochrome c oxidase accessory protein FixG